MASMDSFEPSPWLMGIIAIAGGVVLWWLTPDLVRSEEETLRFVSDRVSPDLARGLRSYYRIGSRVGSVLMVVLGLVILGVAIARG
ncbi:MAG TPA: hypothetical protein VK402_07450 [Blastococcus sp.]|nr:hypothetical protein [Blastococcus sp.]